MKCIFRPSFSKNYEKLASKVKDQFKIRRDIFLKNPFHPILNNHPLHGEYSDFRSINITGDYRVIYFMKDEIAIFIRIGTHSELFKK